MDAGPIVLPTPPIISNYPATIAVGIAAMAAALLVFVASKFDPTKGVLTMSLLIAVAFIGTVAYCLIFTVPTDEVTPSVVGGLTAGFGAVCAHWLGRHHNGSSNGKE
jgi:hypothetical protein